MGRITARFDSLNRTSRKGFIPFITAGDPDIETSVQIVFALAECGADIIELGVPFSDPMADGPTIQASSMRAVENGVTVSNVLDMVRLIRKRFDVPIVLFSYLNPLYRYGIERLAADAAAAGVDGMLITDAVDQEAADIGKLLKRKGLDLISLVAPTTTDRRLEEICIRASGFIYAVSRAGVTGARSETSVAAEHVVSRVRQFTDLPVAVGFGISTREQIEDVWRYADAAVVGSAIVAEIERTNEPGDAAECVRHLVSSLLPAVANTTAEP
ncbi:MAG TPA: tryptophan synthase subunit alpha [Pyrinomonadaceae bacterium]|mgnify:CR=1 FL=1|nr:tryptophan synthase subunit alpha [Pyrinomonadaceae bacterium]